MEGVLRKHRIASILLFVFVAGMVIAIIWYPDLFRASKSNPRVTASSSNGVAPYVQPVLITQTEEGNTPSSSLHSRPPPTINSQPPILNKPVSAPRESVNAHYPGTTLEKEWIIIEDGPTGLTVARRTVYHDTRPSFPPSIVIIILHNHEKRKTLHQLHAKVTLSSGKTFCSPAQHWKQNGDVVLNWHEVTLSHVLRIPLTDESQIPTSIQLSKETSCNNLLPYMPVFHDTVATSKHMFTTCIQKALFDDIKPGEVVNFIELNRALGSSMITIYFHRNLREMDKVYKAIETYVKSGFVEVLGWTIAKHWDDQIFDTALSASATECVYRHSHRSKYMALHDLDEYLIPMKHQDWHEMLKELKTKFDLSQFASLSFANSLFQEKEEKGPEMDCAVPIYFKRYLRDNDPKRSHPKVMVNTNATITAYCHDIKTWKDGLKKELLIPFEIGILFHYRKALEGRISVAKEWKHDTIVNKYMTIVLAAVKKNSCVPE